MFCSNQHTHTQEYVCPVSDTFSSVHVEAFRVFSSVDVPWMWATCVLQQIFLLAVEFGGLRGPSIHHHTVILMSFSSVAGFPSPALAPLQLISTP